MTQPKNPVQAQYEKWVYPRPVMDLTADEYDARRDLADPQGNWHTYWPSEPFRDDIDILIAGCGANAAARYAFHNRRSRVTGIDLSAASLAHERYLKDKHNLTNLTLHQGRLEEVASLRQTFDFIETSGVLHHLPDPVAGLRALGTVLRPNGTIAIMLYGRYGRSRIYQLQELFRILGVGQETDDVAFVKQALKELPESQNGSGPFANKRNDLHYDAGVVDTLLHPLDRSYTVPDCLELTGDAGLSFMAWLDNSRRYPEGQIDPDSELFRRIAALPDDQIWKAMELHSGTLGQHNFCVCLPTRPSASYQIDFTSDRFLDYVPVRRSKEAVPAPTGIPPGSIAVHRDGRSAYVLMPNAAALYRRIDGIRSIRACIADAGLQAADPVGVARSAFLYLWRLGYIFVRLWRAA